MLAPEGKQELRDRRTINSLHYDNGNGTTTANIGVGHQNYLNRFLLGDGVGGWRQLDWTLTPLESGGWTFLYHSFHPGIPQYADDWLTFRDVFEAKDQTVGFKPVCSHVEGRLVLPENLATEGLDKLTSVNAVIYDSAFGEGIDYMVYFTRSQMKKCVRIKNASKETKDYAFKLELQLPEGVDVWRIDENGGYELDLSRSKDFDTEKRTELRTAEGVTYFKPFKVWDSMKGEVCVVSYSVEDGKTYLTKHIPSVFMETSEGDVFTDTTTSYYSGAGDGSLQYGTTGSGDTWAVTHDTDTGTNAIYTDTQYESPQLGLQITTTTPKIYIIRRASLPFDTSGIGAGKVVSAASLNLVSIETYQDQLATAQSFNVVTSNPASTSSLAVGDYDFTKFGTTRLSTDKTIASLPGAGSAFSFTLNAAGLAAISMTGWTVLGMLLASDIDNTRPTLSYGFTVFSHASWRASEYVGVPADHPYLSITYVPAPTGGSFLLNMV